MLGSPDKAQAAMEGRWVIFDADNTLWNVEALYNRARERMVGYVAGLCTDLPAAIEQYQREHDTKLRELYGYSSSRFARSFEDTISQFVPDRSNDQVRHVRSLAEAVFEERAELTTDVELVLRSLYLQGWLLGLLTAGVGGPNGWHQSYTNWPAFGSGDRASPEELGRLDLQDGRQLPDRDAGNFR
jgi:hypothetical protein